jgi:CheY-like chemotaxis protein
MRIVIAEDSAVVRAGLVELLADRGHEVAAAVGDAAAQPRAKTTVTVTLSCWVPGWTGTEDLAAPALAYGSG